ncbi:sigma-54-dependent Fis family transcriptional regulator [Aquihabitans sp. McL0605]|uniref:sigma-54-dependent Fis family transcriptional regulator n=1 Tax=Aquihabitans sp. McL0605 TaxID=3415671 RepID=UPI003CFA1FF5
MGTRRGSAAAPSPRPEIAASWARSSRSGVEGDHLAPPAAPGADPLGRLATLAAPVLDRLSDTLAETRTTVVLTDARAGILDRRAGSSRLHDQLDGLGIVPGYSYAEDVVGTNGMGTAAEERRAVRVVGDEHFNEALRSLTCVGVPIEHPVTGRLEGVLDLTCFNEDAGPWMTPLVAEAVAGVRAMLEAQATAGERALLAAFLRASQRGSDAIVSLSDSFVLTNPAAARLLDGADHAPLWEIGADAVSSRSAPVRELRLTGGAVVRASFEVVELGDRPVGAVVRLTEARGDRSGPKPRRTAPAASVAPSTESSTTARLVAEVRAAVDAGEQTLLRGPAGSGKFTVAQMAVGDAGTIVFDAGRAVVDGARQWLTAVDAALAGGGVVIIRHVDVLAADAASGLAAILDAAPATARVVATGDATQALVDRFGHLTKVPGLGERSEELPALVRSMMGRLVPTGAVRVAPEVVQALGRVDLPGNLRQLEAMLHRVAVSRRSGTITLDDLPPEVRAATHRPHLTAMEQHECEAIAEALSDADGNKVVAAQALGISRSTLYRKLEAYGLQLDRRAW